MVEPTEPPAGEPEAPEAPAAEIETATRSAVAAREAAAAARQASEAEARRPRSLLTTALLLLGALWVCACLGAIATVVYHSSPMGDAGLRQAIAQQSYAGSYVPTGGLPPDFVITANLMSEEDYGLLVVGRVVIALRDADRYSWGSYDLNVTPTGNGSRFQSSNSGSGFEFRVASEADRTQVFWNQARLNFRLGRVYVGNQSWPIDGPTTTVFLARDGKVIEAIQQR